MKRHILIFILVTLSFWNREASAFWGTNSTDSASGLNVSAGFDINTMTTLNGTVISPPERKGQEQHTVMSVAATQGAVTVILGPWWYWKNQNISITKNQELAITGSLAQGKDGALYLFVQRIENRSNGEAITLRSESGKPFWSHSASDNQKGIHQYNGSGQRYGAGNNGGGMRGGGR
jgi:hypothetical protein